MIVYPVTRAAHAAAHRAAAQSFSRVLERFFDDGFAAARGDVRTPAIDVIETDAAYRIAFDVPGASRESLKATVEGRRVVLETLAPQAEAPKAEASSEPAASADAAVAAERTLYRERAAARYARTVVLPAEVDAASAEARLENGVLTLTLAKKQPAGKVQIRVA
ncbi:MAG TPA: Hsp20/alpha crystallin family protein [Caldimonas sp.]|nr:Hsp20/alpha crystallin family protein [Caldimonas sp.]